MNSICRKSFFQQHGIIPLLLNLIQRSLYRILKAFLFSRIMNLEFYNNCISIAIIYDCVLSTVSRLQQDIIPPEAALPIGCDDIPVSQFHGQPQHKTMIK